MQSLPSVTDIAILLLKGSDYLPHAKALNNETLEPKGLHTYIPS